MSTIIWKKNFYTVLVVLKKIATTKIIYFSSDKNMSSNNSIK